MKRGQIVFGDIKNWILALLFLIAILVLIFLNKERMVDLVVEIKNIFRFGG
jgi:preprotein translocase subunit SecG